VPSCAELAQQEMHKGFFKAMFGAVIRWEKKNTISKVRPNDTSFEVETSVSLVRGRVKVTQG
jgi:hypothetical protein